MPTRARRRSACCSSPRSAASCSPPALALVGRGDLVARRSRSSCCPISSSARGENLIAAFLPELAAGRGARPHLRLGLEPRLSRRAGGARRVPRLRHARAGARRDAATEFVPVDDADHRRHFRRWRASRRSCSCASARGPPPGARLRERRVRAACAQTLRDARALRRPAALPRLRGVLSGRHPGGDRARGGLRAAGRWASRRATRSCSSWS